VSINRFANKIERYRVLRTFGRYALFLYLLFVDTMKNATVIGVLVVCLMGKTIYK